MTNTAEVQVKPVSEEQINNAMLSSLEGFGFLVLDSLEFELGRKLTEDEGHQISRAVDRAVIKGTSHE